MPIHTTPPTLYEDTHVHLNRLDSIYVAINSNFQFQDEQKKLREVTSSTSPEDTFPLIQTGGIKR